LQKKLKRLRVLSHFHPNIKKIIRSLTSLRQSESEDVANEIYLPFDMSKWLGTPEQEGIEETLSPDLMHSGKRKGIFPSKTNNNYMAT